MGCDLIHADLHGSKEKKRFKRKITGQYLCRDNLILNDLYNVCVPLCVCVKMTCSVLILFMLTCLSEDDLLGPDILHTDLYVWRGLVQSWSAPWWTVRRGRRVCPPGWPAHSGAPRSGMWCCYPCKSNNVLYTSHSSQPAVFCLLHCEDRSPPPWLAWGGRTPPPLSPPAPTASWI